MSWVNPPPAVAALRSMLIACPSAVAAGIVSARVHYPQANPQADALPFAVLSESDHRRTAYAEAGVQGLPSGTLDVSLHYVGDAGALETMARAIAGELGQQIGLPNISATIALCSDPDHGERADAANGGTGGYRTIDIHVTYGLSG